MKQEVEILFKLNEDINDVLAKLKNLTLEGAKRTVDTYYTDSLRDDLNPLETGRLLRCFRLRETKSQNLMTYKIDHFSKDEWLYSDEFETEVADASIAKNIFANLGLNVLVVVDSTKTILTNDKFEVALEEVKGLGSFIEVEYRSSDNLEDISAAKQHIRDWLREKGIKVGNEMNAGKPELLLRANSK